MIFDLRNRGKWNLHDLPVRDLNLDAGSGEGLSGLHTANRASHPPAVGCNDLDVVLAVKWLQGRERFGYLHNEIPSLMAWSNFAR